MEEGMGSGKSKRVLNNDCITGKNSSGKLRNPWKCSSWSFLFVVSMKSIKWNMTMEIQLLEIHDMLWSGVELKQAIGSGRNLQSLQRIVQTYPEEFNRKYQLFHRLIQSRTVTEIIKNRQRNRGPNLIIILFEYTPKLCSFAFETYSAKHRTISEDEGCSFEFSIYFLHLEFRFYLKYGLQKPLLAPKLSLFRFCKAHFSCYHHICESNNLRFP